MKSVKYILATLICIIFPIAITSFSTAAPKVYIFGVVPQFEARKLAGIWLPILRELEKRTGLRFRMAGSQEIPDFERAFMAEKFDFAYMNPYHAMLANKLD